MNYENEILKRVIGVLSDVLDTPVQSIGAETSPDTNDSWDSMKHLNIVMTIEEEFGITLSPEEQMEMLTAGLIADLIFEKSGQ
jgi:acyl carrier protein